MNILAVEASGSVAGVAYVEDNVLKAEFTLNHKMTHSQTLMPLIGEIKEKLSLDLSDIDYIACSQGPGSFTGLRIGAATAKGIAMGIKRDIIPVSSLAGLAYNIFMTDALICPIIDARRNQVYTALYEWEGDRLVNVSPDKITMIDDALNEAAIFERPVIFVGDGIFVHRDKILANEDFVIAPASCNMPRAASIASLGRVIAEEGGNIEGSKFVPVYLRKSQAERELEEKMQGAAKK